MLGYIIQRLIQSAFVMLAMSALVFLGVYAIENPKTDAAMMALETGLSGR